MSLITFTHSQTMPMQGVETPIHARIEQEVWHSGALPNKNAIILFIGLPLVGEIRFDGVNRPGRSMSVSHCPNQGCHLTHLYFPGCSWLYKHYFNHISLVYESQNLSTSCITGVTWAPDCITKSHQYEISWILVSLVNFSCSYGCIYEL